MEQTDKTLSRSVLEFATIATEYCILIENIESTDNHTQLTQLKQIVSLLYFRGTLLPDIEPSDPDTTERYVTEEQWEISFNQLRAYFKQQDIFWFPEYFAEQSETLRVSLSELLTDCYQDLKDFILLYKRQSLSARENAIFEIKQLFAMNWGKKLALLIPYLHQLSYQKFEEQALPEDF